MASRIHQFMCLSDNYGVLLHDPETRSTAAIDVPDAQAVRAALETTGWTLTDILVTHRHADHIQGIPEIKKAYPDTRVVGPAKEADAIGRLDLAVGEGDYVKVGSLKASVIEVPGHTAGHIAYHFAEEDILFAGDTLFALGCGRPADPSASRTLHRSLMKLARLPGSTEVYCGHEYTKANAAFALSVDADNELLVERAAEIDQLRDAGEFTLPTTISIEQATNPFLRTETREIKAALGMPDADPVEVFVALRDRKNRA